MNCVGVFRAALFTKYGDIFIDELSIKSDFVLKCYISDISILKDTMLPIVKKLEPSYVVVYGDTSSSMAATLVAAAINSKIIHLETCVRDFDSNAPEEFLRVRIGEVAGYHFAPSELCKTILSCEQITA